MQILPHLFSLIFFNLNNKKAPRKLAEITENVMLLHIRGEEGVDGKQHQMTELRSLPCPYESISKALSHLMAEERIIQQDGVILRG